MKIGFVTYVGNAAASRAITGLGFKPDFVFIKRRTSGGTLNTGALAFRPSIEDTLLTQDAGGNTGAVRVLSMDDDGFTVNDNELVNANTIEYHAWAFQGHPLDCVVGQYSGNGVDNRDITGIPFAPDLVLVASGGAYVPVFATSLSVAGESLRLIASAGHTDAILALNADGFRIGTNSAVNTAVDVYNFIALKLVPGSITLTSYTGNLTDDRTITGAGYDPDNVLVANNVAAGTQHKPWHPAQIGRTTDVSLVLSNAGTISNAVQQLITDGFQVGTATSVNADTVPYLALMMRAVNTQQPDLVGASPQRNHATAAHAVETNRIGPTVLSGNRGGTTAREAALAGVSGNRGLRAGGAPRANRIPRSSV